MASATAVPVSGSKLDNRRVLAALIDLLIVGAGYVLILAAADKLDAPSTGGALTAVGVGWALYYYFACESGAGQTVGKRLMKIRVVSTDGSPAGMRAIGLRTVLRLIDGLFLYLVGLIVMLATGERRGRLGDLVGNTMIVSADQPAPQVNMSAPEAPAAALRVPIAESGPAFEPVPEAEAVAAEPAGAEPAAAEPQVAEPAAAEAQPDVASPSLQELASDVSAVTEDPVREAQPAPAADEQVTVKSVETISAIDLVMEDDEEAVAGRAKSGE